MKKITSLTKLRLLFLFLFLVGAIQSKAIDDVIKIQTIVGGDSYPNVSVNPLNLISPLGLNPDPTTDVANTTYQIKDWKCWHTSGNDNSKAWLLVDLGKSILVKNMYLWNLNQWGNPDRDIKNITITYSVDSSDGVNGSWQTMGDYIIPQTPGDGQPCKAQITINLNVSARFVKIQAKSSYGSQYWGLGKIIMVQDHLQDNYDAQILLKTLLQQSQTYKFYNYTYASWQLLLTAMQTAKVLIDNMSTDIPAVEAAHLALQNTITGLLVKPNLGIGSTGSASAFYGLGYEAQNGLDGSFDKRWASTTGTDFWYKIDLGTEKGFNQLMIFETPQYSGRIEKSSISVSNDGVTWTQWRVKYWRENYVSIVGDSVNSRYIKIEFSNCSPAGINIDEIMLFNDSSAIETGEPTPQRPIDPTWIHQTSDLSPNIYQIRKQNLKYGMFIHYGINTFIGQEWSDGSYPASTYHPDLSQLNPDSWVKAAYNGGMNFIILVAKHHDGFATWNTSVGTYNINYTGRDGDKRDIVKEVSVACKKYGIKFGLYYSAWDRNWDLNHTIQSSGLDRVALNQLYNDYALSQVTELMDGRYGEISEFWIDGSWVKKNEDWEFARLYNTVKSFQPTCQFGVNATLNEVLPDQVIGGEEIYYFPSDFRLKDPFFTKSGVNQDPKIYSHQGNSYYLPFEATICINNSWFWNSGQNESSVIKPSVIMSSYNHMVEQKNTIVLNLSPSINGIFNNFDTSGLYAGACDLGIERGDARATIQSGECAVEIRFLTNKGYIAYPSKYIYGLNDDSYNVNPVYLDSLGYKLVILPDNTSGKFSSNRKVVEFIYEDTGIITNYTKLNTINQFKNKVYYDDGKINLIFTEPSNVQIYDTIGIKVKEFNFEQKGNVVIDNFNLKGLYFVKFANANKEVDTVKILLH